MVLLTAFPWRRPLQVLLLLLLPLRLPPLLPSCSGSRCRPEGCCRCRRRCFRQGSHARQHSDVKVSAGASVKAGDVLVILEAMKMENEILAPQDGTVASVNVNKGDTVNSGDVLVSMN